MESQEKKGRNFNIKTIETEEGNEVVDFVASSISKQLERGKKVLFFVTGGSSIPICIKIAELLKNHPHQNLTVMLTDERYGPINHTDSNWAKLIEGGFSLPQAKLIPILIGENREFTTENFNENLEKEFKNAEYKIGLFGIGADGHTAGILPESMEVDSLDWDFGYDSAVFSRITMSFKAIEKLDEAVAFVRGENKWGVIKDLDEKDIDPKKQPAQILKKVPLLTIFTDYKVR